MSNPILAALMRIFTATAPVETSTPAPKPKPATLADAIAHAAESQMGIKETSKNQGAGIAKYWEATNYKAGYAHREPWCAAFVCWCILTAIAELGIVPQFKRPDTARAFGFDEWGRAMRGRGVEMVPVNAAIKRGDIVVYSHSHVEIAVEDSAPGQPVTLIGGNTSDGATREGDRVGRKTNSRRLFKAVVRIA